MIRRSTHSVEYLTMAAASQLECSFCGKTADRVRKLIAGPTVYICDECIDLCNDIIAEEYEYGDPPSDPASGSANAEEAAARPAAIRPARLRTHDRIAVAAPAGAFDPEALARGIGRLRALGFDVTHRPDIGERMRYLAGSDERRAAELRAYLVDPEIRAIVCARGGYGTARALEHVGSPGEVATPKIVVGYSDVTFLLNAITSLTGVVTFHGPQAAVDLAQDEFQESLDSMLDTLTGKRFPGPFQTKPLTTLVPGTAEGVVLGGCLSILVTMIGTPFEPNFHGAILFLEDIAEPAFRIDRMLTHLRQAGKLEGVAGIVIGYLKDCRAPEGTTLVDVLLDCLKPLGVPVAMGLESGHGVPCRTLPLGVRARLDAAAGTLEILEPVVE